MVRVIVKYSDNIIPTMTSNTAPTGIASASSTYSITYDAWKAFDRIDNNTFGWMTATGALTGWIAYEFKEPTLVSSYTIKSISSQDRMAKAWTFEGSNDSVAWTILDTKVNESSWTDGQVRTYNISNVNKYKKYRLNITANNGNTTATCIGELGFYQVLLVNKILLLSTDGKARNVTSLVVKNETSIPKMTSSTAPSGLASASSESSGAYGAFRAFDRTTTEWSCVSGVNKAWVSYEYLAPVLIAKYSVGIGSYQNAIISAPKSWTFEGWDGSQWIALDSIDGISDWTINESKTFTYKNKTLFKKYRLNVTQTNNGTTLKVSELEMFEATSLPVVKALPSESEQSFINYGMSQSELASIDMSADFAEKYYIQDASTALGDGKVFEQVLDSTKVTKKILIK